MFKNHAKVIRFFEIKNKKQLNPREITSTILKGAISILSLAQLPKDLAE
jgi:hypothetical protein